MKKSSNTFKALDFFYFGKLEGRVYQTGELDSCWMLRWGIMSLACWAVVLVVVGTLITTALYPYFLLIGLAKFDLGMLAAGVVLNLMFYIVAWICLDDYYNWGTRAKVGDFLDSTSEKLTLRNTGLSTLCTLIAAMLHKICLKVKVDNDE